jgi:hypothetical protein
VKNMTDAQPFAFEGSIRQRMTFLSPAQVAAATGGSTGERPPLEALFGAPREALAIPEDAVAETTVSFRRGQIRIDPPRGATRFPGAEGLYMLIDYGSGQMRMVLPALKRVFIVPPEMSRAMLAGVTPAIAADSSSSLRELGPGTIDGVETVGFEATGGNATMRAWLAPGYRSASQALTLMASALPGSPPPAQRPGGIPTDRGLPMRIETLAPVPEAAVGALGQGWMFSRVEVTAVEEKPLSATLFDMPEGFEISEMPVSR